MTATSIISIKSAAEVNTVHDLGVASFTASLNAGFNFTNGTGAGKIQAVYSDRRTLAASATDSLDLSDTLTDKFNTVIAFTSVKGIMLKADAANVDPLMIGGAGASGFNSWLSGAGDAVKVMPGGCLVLIAPDATGYPVTAGSGDLLEVVNTGGSEMNYELVIIGE